MIITGDEVVDARLSSEGDKIAVVRILWNQSDNQAWIGPQISGSSEVVHEVGCLLPRDEAPKPVAMEDVRQLVEEVRADDEAQFALLPRPEQPERVPLARNRRRDQDRRVRDDDDHGRLAPATHLPLLSHGVDLFVGDPGGLLLRKAADRLAEPVNDVQTEVTAQGLLVYLLLRSTGVDGGLLQGSAHSLVKLDGDLHGHGTMIQEPSKMGSW